MWWNLILGRVGFLAQKILVSAIAGFAVGVGMYHYKKKAEQPNSRHKKVVKHLNRAVGVNEDDEIDRSGRPRKQTPYGCARK
jgi:hypothetical protein